MTLNSILYILLDAAVLFVFITIGEAVSVWRIRKKGMRGAKAHHRMPVWQEVLILLGVALVAAGVFETLRYVLR